MIHDPLLWEWKGHVGLLFSTPLTDGSVALFCAVDISLFRMHPCLRNVGSMHVAIVASNHVTTLRYIQQAPNARRRPTRQTRRCITFLTAVFRRFHPSRVSPTLTRKMFEIHLTSQWRHTYCTDIAAESQTATTTTRAL